MARHRRRRRAPVRALVAAGFTALCVLAFGSVGTLSGWASGAVGNAANTVLTGQVAITHTYDGTSCIGTPRSTSAVCSPTIGTTASPPATRTDQILNSSTVPITQSVTGLSCGVVGLANSNMAADPMLPRYMSVSGDFGPTAGPTGVSGSGAITLGTSDYAAGVVSQSLPGSATGLVNIGTAVKLGYGIWFNTASASGQIFGIGSHPSNSPSTGSTTFDRTLSLSAGKLVFAASGAATATTTSAFNDGAWHYAYVSLQTTTDIGVGGLAAYTTTVTIYVDGKSRGSSASGATATALSTASGYWFLGSGFTGSLSNFAVYNSTGSPTSPPAAPYSSASELWPLNDTGYATTTATLPTVLQRACDKVSITLTFASPSATVGPTTLTTFANGTATVVAAPASGGTQTLTIATSKSSSPAYASDIAGLRLYVPIRFAYATTPNTSWTQTFSWSGSPLDVFIA